MHEIELNKFIKKFKGQVPNKKNTLTRFGQIEYYRKLEPSLRSLIREETGIMPNQGDYMEQRRLILEIARDKAEDKENFWGAAASALVGFLPQIFGGLFGGGDDNEALKAELARQAAENEKQRQTLYAVAGLAAVIIAFLAFKK